MPSDPTQSRDIMFSGNKDIWKAAALLAGTTIVGGAITFFLLRKPDENERLEDEIEHNEEENFISEDAAIYPANRVSIQKTEQLRSLRELINYRDEIARKQKPDIKGFKASVNAAEYLSESVFIETIFIISFW